MAEAEKKKRPLPKGRHKSQIKRERQNLKRHLRNISENSLLKTTIKKVRAAATQKNKDLASKLLIEASKIIQKSASKGIIHKRNAARKISRLSVLVHSLT
jgi:small subunit ribosomal protein S20